MDLPHNLLNFDHLRMWCRCSCCSLGPLDFLENAVIFWKVPSLVHSPISDTGSMRCFLFPGTDFCFRVNFLKSAFDPFSHHKTRLLILLIRKQKSQKSQESVACSSCPSFYSPLGLHEAPGIGRSGRPHEFKGQRYERWGLRGGSKVEAKPQKDAEKSHM